MLRWSMRRGCSIRRLTADVLVGTCRVWRGAAAERRGVDGGECDQRGLRGVSGGALTASCAATESAGAVAGGGRARRAAAVAVAECRARRCCTRGWRGRSMAAEQLRAGMCLRLAAGIRRVTATVWTDLAKSPVINDAADAGVFNPGGFDISSVVADPHDATGKTVYATVMGFAGNGIECAACVPLGGWGRALDEHQRAICRMRRRTAWWSIRTTRTRCMWRWIRGCM